MIRPRVAVTSVVVAACAAALLTFVVDRKRTADLQVALDRVVRSQVNDQLRERCESDPKWFLTGPLEGRPKGGQPAITTETNEEALPPRPKIVPMPYELFGYDEQFVGSSSATPRFPQDFRRIIRSSTAPIFAPYEVNGGTGIQMALSTGWIGSPCQYLLGRMEPPTDQKMLRVWNFATFFAVALFVALGASAESIWRMRRLASHVRQAVKDDYASIGPDAHKDEISSVVFMYNDAAKEIHERRARIEDQEETLRRFVQSTGDEVARPLVGLEAELGAIEMGKSQDMKERVRSALSSAHDLSQRMENLTSAARLRMTGVPIETRSIDLNALVARVATRYLPIAHAAGVPLFVSAPQVRIQVQTDETLFECALANVVDNAIRYNRPGGDVRITLSRVDAEKRFRLCVTDTGRGVTDDMYRGLTSVRRFRGDESRVRRPNAPGLGLAVTREAADRLQLTFDLKRPASGGLEAEFSGVMA